ncbi:glutamine synthetase, catalytic domain-containing protein [Sarocladium implicatum]|nr:glutamine synthetase, catalytic domain-containing protein [Sarocladium implicatum]
MPASKDVEVMSERLRAIVDTTPIIDNHAHPLLKLAYVDKFPLLAIATEANGDAIESSRSSLAHIRAVNQLSTLLACEPTWNAVSAAIQAKRQGKEYHAWVQRCVAGIEAILVDDGLGNPDQAESYQYFDQFTPSKSKRIVRIEYLATLMIKSALETKSTRATAWGKIVNEFDQAIRNCIEDPEVVGFKSVICYRTGLDIGPRAGYEARAEESFAALHEASSKDPNYVFERLSHRGLNEYLVHRLAELIRESKGSWKKPIQFHTGLGDNDINLVTSNPSYLQPFIREYPEVPIVLLHASYPFTREAGYLAAMYAHVYADIGEVFPFVSRGGQEAIIRQILELCPSSKILWSTDGHYFPETYLLAVDQMRDALKTVLLELTTAGDLNLAQAEELVEDVLFSNSNKLYNLGLAFTREAETYKVKGADLSRASSGLSKLPTADLDAKFLRISWTDLASTSRLKLVPMHRVKSLAEEGEPLSCNVLTLVMGMLPNDTLVEGAVPIGEAKMVPDWTTLKRGPKEGHMVVRGDLQDFDGGNVSTCPRSALKGVLAAAAKQGINIILGFEIEFVLLQRKDNDFERLDLEGHAWCVGRSIDSEAGPVLENAILRLEEAGVFVEAAHPESAHGQFEIVLQRKPALEAVDNLLLAREVISACANERGLRMTLHPKPFANAPGSAAHVHMSISGPKGKELRLYEPFYAGILKHLRAVLAFTCSSTTSYDRVQDGCWAGGTWVAWGTQNRETPLRKVEDSHWEVKCMDGTANPYLALAALIGAGLSGVRSGEELVLKDCCRAAPAVLSAEERADLNIEERLPTNLDEALAALREDVELAAMMGQELVDLYVKVKKAEMKMMEALDVTAKRRWVIEHY